MKTITAKTVRFAIIAIALSFSPLLHAQIVTYSDPTAFNAATSTSTITFEGLDLSSVGYTYLGTSETTEGLTFADSNGLYAITNGFGASWNDLSTAVSGASNATETITLPTGVTAFGGQFYPGTATAENAVLDVYLTGNPTLSFATPVPDGTYSFSANAVNQSLPTTFFGVTTSSGSIAEIVLEASNSTLGTVQPVEDNIQFGTANAVPEPSTWAMMLGGLGLLLVIIRGRSVSSV